MKFIKTIFLFSLVLGVINTSGIFAQSHIPRSHQQEDFLLAPPGTFGDGLLGYENPAMLSFFNGPEMLFVFSDEEARWNSIKRWGLFAGIPHVGFGMIRNALAGPQDNSKTSSYTVTDYRLSFSVGNKGLGLGVGYGWARGDVQSLQRDGVWTAGLLSRPNKYLSLGLRGVFARHHSEREGLISAAFRPWGKDRVTVFGDYALHNSERIEDGPWSIGAVVRPLPGIHITGRYFSSETMTFGVSFALGSASLTSQAHVADNSSLSYSTWGVRLGSAKDNVVDRYMKNRKHYLFLDLNGPVKYQKFRFFDAGGLTLLNVLTALKAAANDNRVAGVALNISGLRCSWEMIWEIREHLVKIRNNGKHVIMYIDRGGMQMYHLASVADYIVMDPEGLLILNGLVSGSTYIAGVMEKLGLGFEEWRYFTYKSAAEMYGRKNMSDADSVQRQELLQDFYDLMAEDVTESRNFTKDKFDNLINEMSLFLPQIALEQGLVDTIGRWADVGKIIHSFEGENKKPISSNALVKNRSVQDTWGENPAIAVVYAKGVCAMDTGIRARQLSKVIDAVANSSRVKAMVFRIDSPGGDGLASDLVADALRKCKKQKPVVVSQGSVAASGGYWLSMYADTIVSAPITITGSIGVIGGWVWNNGFGDKVGLTSDFVKVGKHADVGFGIRLPIFGLSLPDRNLTDEEKEKVRKAFFTIYNNFVGKVATSRNMEIAQVERIAQGRVWSGRASRQIGLVDEMGTLWTAIDIAKNRANIANDQEVELIELPQRGWFDLGRFLPSYFGMKNDASEIWTIEYLNLIAKLPGQPLLMLPHDFYLYQD